MAKDGHEDTANQRDLKLVTRAKKGDKNAFGELVELYQKRVYSLAFGIVRRREDAWDIAQEAFVKAYQNLSKFNGKSSFYTWIYRITYNLAIDTIRSKSRKSWVPIDETPNVEGAMARNGNAEMEHPDTESGRKELRKVLTHAMEQLTDKHRAIIVLREIEGLSYEEMANVLGISKGTVMSRLFHARQKLQELLTPYVTNPDSGPGSLELSLSRASARGRA